MDQEIEPIEDDRRSVIEAAFEKEEATNPDPVQQVVEPEVTTQQVEPEATKQAEPVQQTVAEDTNTPVKAPQSWKPATRAQWDKLPPEVRQEVARREHQTSVVLNESAQARKVATDLFTAAQPYSARLQSLGIDPVSATRELLKSDHLLTTAPKTQRAQYMAKLIKDYDVDIEALDAALSGQVSHERDPEVQIQTKVQQLLQQQLAPYQSLLVEQQQRAAMEQQQLAQTIQSYATNTAKYPYFEQVRQEMADLIEISARRGAPLTIEQAYNKAIQLDPNISSEVANQQKLSLAAKANAQAQRAIKASSSVGGAPSSGLLGSPVGSDRRSTIAAAFDSLGGR